MDINQVSRKIDRFFCIQLRGSTITTEVRGGFVTFLAMSYILFVNPMILSQAVQLPSGNSFQQILTATALSAAFGSIMMGLIANYPFALAPGMGLNAYFTYTVVMTMGIPWQTALAAILVSSLLFLALTLTGARQAIIQGIPDCLKRATVCGIGFFLAFIGFVNSGIVKAHPQTLVALGSFSSPSTLLACGGLLVTGVLLIRKVPGAILIGMAVISLTAIIFKLPVFQGQTFSGFDNGPIAAPVWPKDIFLAYNFSGLFEIGAITVIFTFFFVEFFDNAGTFIGLAQKIGLFDKKSSTNIRVREVFMTDAIACSVGSALGTSTVTSYVESAAGIEEGAKTGLAAVVTGVLFALCIFLWPLAQAIPAVATAPVLILIGALMMESGANIHWTRLEEAIPAFLTMTLMTLTYSIANGISFGILSYVALVASTKTPKHVPKIMWILAIAVLGKYAFMLI